MNIETNNNMNLKKLNNEELISHLKTKVADERKILTQILRDLREVESRKLFAQMGYPSLFEFCVRELQYSEGSAQRRISAMRLIRELPEIENKIASGDLSLSVVSQAQSFFRNQAKMQTPININEKLKLLTTLEKTSTRECERKLLALDPRSIKPDFVRAITPELTELRFTVGQDFMNKITRIKNLLSHKNPNIETQAVLAQALDHWLIKLDPIKQTEIPPPALEVKVRLTPPHKQLENLPPAPAVKIRPPTAPNHRYIPKTLRRLVWQKSQSQCAYIELKSGRRCSAQRFLEVDHLHPISLGGANNIENLQLLCDAHNRLKGATVIKSML